ncbi:hypothetical protein AA101099_2000 [Neoasaia chiangmaiensis NBRC 101099]|uniref:Uncharacterized protein n=1 Tax=Neoasaia chiangmaiensis TaxID=320497 RepID=A0A1U9KT58_9PROT|nr:DUF2945 domain-containing protein [Neoasaia chiangmaiensis]AQS88993.1 hypothetical protein A0U93_14900 [Neoasaia chiangmaiensis]GBR40193.1 hypothetical protein AA101099_2000 [Neoasaia chiangmaiensis NBRC 101099]GEN14015.1 hypothetical protein NCH01_04460 [Neoasaia chiangmaiensis]
MTDTRFKKGDAVTWKTQHGETHGHVEKTITKQIKIKNNDVKALAKNPKIVVKSDKTQAKAAHKPDALSRK